MKEVVSEEKKQTEVKKTFPSYVQRIPLPISCFIAFYMLSYSFGNREMIMSVLRIDANSNTLESKIQMFCTMLFPLGLIVALLLQITMVSRIYYRRPNPTDQKDPLFIVFMNRLIDNSIQTNFVYIINLGYFIFCNNSQDTQEIVKRNTIVVCVGIVYAIGRILFCIYYAFGLAVNITTFRAFGLIPSHFVTIMLVLANLGYNVFASYFHNSSL